MVAVVEHGIGLLLLLFAVGILGLIVTLVTLFVHTIGGIIKAIFGIGRSGQPRRNRHAGAPGFIACPRPGCGRLNRPEAHYCGSCGTQLNLPHTDTYG